MPYNGKTDWKLNDTVYPEDMNRIEGQIGKNTSEIEGVSGKIGNSSDNEEQLTLFGKLAALLKKVMGIDDKVGTSEDEKTSPTLFGKIAGIGDTLSENLTPVTEKIAEVLTKVTGIDTKIGTSGDTAGTVTLFGQIKTIVDTLAGKRYRYSNTVQHTEEQSYTLGDNTAIMYNFIAEYDGNIHISVDYQRNGKSANTVACIHAIAESSWYCKGDGGNENLIETLLSSETGTTLNQKYGGTFWDNSSPYYVYGGLTTKTGRDITKSQIHLILHVKKGDQVVIAAVGFRESGESVTYSNLKVMYDLK